MGIVKEIYGCNNDECRLVYKHSITGILTDQEELLEKLNRKIERYTEELLEKQNVSLADLESILDKAFASAEEQIERELYKKGLMTCNAYLESIEDMRIHGNDLVHAYIQELDKKYKEN